MRTYIRVIGLVLLAYWVASYATYSVRHPEKTQTQKLLNIKDVLLFK